MALDELFKAMDMFKQGAQEYATSRAIGDAQQQISDLKNQEVDGIKQRQGLMDIAHNLTLNMARVGAPVSQQQSAAGAIMPTPIRDAQDAYLQGLQVGGTQGQALMDIGTQGQKFEEDPKMALAKLQGDYHLQASREAGSRAAEKANAKLDEETVKRFDKFDKDMNPYQARSGSWGDLTKQALQTKKLQALFGGPTGYNLTGPMTEEAALGLHRLLTGASSAHVEQVKALIPPTAMSSGKTLKQYWDNHPELLNNQDFMKNLAMTAEREGGVVVNQYKDIAYMNAMRKGDLQTAKPDRFESAIKADPVLDMGEFNQFVQDRAQGKQPSYWTPSAPPQEPQWFQDKSGNKFKGIKLPNGKIQKVSDAASSDKGQQVASGSFYQGNSPSSTITPQKDNESIDEYINRLIQNQADVANSQRTFRG